MAWAIIANYTSKCAQMEPQQLPETSKFYSRSKKCDIEKTLVGWYHPLGSPKVNNFNCFSIVEFAICIISLQNYFCVRFKKKQLLHLSRPIPAPIFVEYRHLLFLQKGNGRNTR